ncbi:hypothetical protein CBH49_004520 [Salmonella enterica subsp. enterica serovar Chester]|nr:hypothetical protein [Salmonella enterica subsp. enterica serovar Chester]EDQ0237825.1 hypothetical protein [Salmonella enterica subsp. enterica serovar Chester]
MYKFLPSGVFTIEPYSSGSLSGLNFSIKDNINIAQYKTSYGSPSWQVNIRLPFIRGRLRKRKKSYAKPKFSTHAFCRARTSSVKLTTSINHACWAGV